MHPKPQMSNFSAVMIKNLSFNQRRYVGIKSLPHRCKACRPAVQEPKRPTCQPLCRDFRAERIQARQALMQEEKVAISAYFLYNSTIKTGFWSEKIPRSTMPDQNLPRQDLHPPSRRHFLKIVRVSLKVNGLYMNQACKVEQLNRQRI